MNTDKNNTQLPQSSVKSRFFGQYIEQIVAKETKYPNSPTINTTTVFSINDLSNYHLELKPLSKMTDKDAEELLPFVSFQFSSKYTDNDIKEEIKKSVLDTEMMPSELFDFLRSKGYALPFMNYSVEDLVSFGWVQLF
jgi:hypothetical protein